MHFSARYSASCAPRRRTASDFNTNSAEFTARLARAHYHFHQALMSQQQDMDSQ